MAWSASKVFSAFVTDSFNRTAPFDLNADSFKAALYNNSITPDNTVAASLTGFNAATSQWTTTNEQSSSGQWASGGVALASVTSSFSSTTYTFDAADTASGSTATISGAYGCLVYDDTLTTPVADQGVCYNYFGGVASVTSGTFTVVWSASGIMSFSVA